jgi:hypothetical protein
VDKRNWRSAQGRTRRFYVKTRRTPTSLWVTAGGADSEAQLAALIGRVQARYPERELAVVDTTAALVAAA